MPNPLFDKFNQNASQMMPGPFGNMTNLMQKLNEFQSAFQGNSYQQVQDLLNSGRMSQQQFNQYSQIAQMIQQFQHMMGR